MRISPQPGPQTEFLSTSADIAIFGGAAGGGKTYGVIMDVLRHCNVPGFTGKVFRRELVQITEAGSLWDETQKIYPLTGGTSRGTPHLDWKWPSSARVSLGHLQHEDDKRKYQGAQFAGIWFEELTHFTESQFWYLFSRNRSVCGVRPFIRATTNPDATSWVRKLIDWWIGPEGYPIKKRSGVIRYFARVGDELIWGDSQESTFEAACSFADPGDAAKLKPSMIRSLTFIASKLTDNKILMEKDPDYQGKLLSMTRVERERLEGGNWNIQDSDGTYFQREWFPRIQTLDPKLIAYEARAYDFAASAPSAANPDPDWTRSVKGVILLDGKKVITDMRGLRDGWAGVQRHIERTAMLDGDTCEIGGWQDPGGAGKAQAEGLHADLSKLGFSYRYEPASKNKQAYATPVSAAAENGKISVLVGPWNEAFFRELEGFPAASHDDIADALSRLWRMLARPTIVGYEGTNDRTRLGRFRKRVGHERRLM